MNFYTILNDNGVTIDDHSQSLKDFTTNSVNVALTDSSNLYVGFYKPFKQFYVELKPFNTVSGDMVFEYYNGTDWTTLTVIDETSNFFNSGFVYFDKPEDWSSTTVDSKDRFYIRMQPSVSHDAGTTIHGIGVLLSNDLDLIGIKSNIVSKLNNGNSWVGKHESARKYIIQKLRNLGNKKYNSEEVRYKDITEFDLLEPFELREASKFYVLSYIYLDELSDEQDDKWERSGNRHLQRADEAVNLFMLKLDVDDDGTEDTSESLGNTGTMLSWL